MTVTTIILIETVLSQSHVVMKLKDLRCHQRDSCSLRAHVMMDTVLAIYSVRCFTYISFNPSNDLLHEIGGMDPCFDRWGHSLKLQGL